ncbi:hypothetical protein [uncultured Ramlibacter sp.]|uniref:hypothetical protein n=1 Tax=uncultured Ramlibacter sp. TaxID=260755 RepID=UPI002620CB18|nr:hypothetical protein [uncultured Ramlibacter sp.]
MTGMTALVVKIVWAPANTAAHAMNVATACFHLPGKTLMAYDSSSSDTNVGEAGMKRSLPSNDAQGVLACR